MKSACSFLLLLYLTPIFNYDVALAEVVATVTTDTDYIIIPKGENEQKFIRFSYYNGGRCEKYITIDSTEDVSSRTSLHYVISYRGIQNNKLKIQIETRYILRWIQPFTFTSDYIYYGSAFESLLLSLPKSSKAKLVIEEGIPRKEQVMIFHKTVAK